MTLLRFTLKSIVANRVRFLLTTLAVVVGVAFTVGVLITTNGLRSTFDDLSEDIFEGVDLSVRSEVEFGDRDLDAPLVDVELLPEVRQVEGVAAAEGGIFQFNVVPINAEGEALEISGPPQLGISWPENQALSQVSVWPDGVSRPPRGPDEFAMDANTAQDNDFFVGERYRISLPTGTQEFELVGLFRFGSAEEGSVGAQITAWDVETARQLLHDGGGYDSIDVQLEPGTDREQVAAAIADRLEPLSAVNLEVVPNEQLVEEQTDAFNEFISIFQTFLLAFAVVILVVSAFIIYNTFNIIIGQRIRELGLLRALGASGRQVTLTVLGEALVVGLAATAAGLGLGVLLNLGIRAVFNQLELDLPDTPIILNTATILAAVFIGVGVTMVSAVWPALRARRISPMAAISEDVRLGASDIRRAPVLGTLLGGIGVALAVAGMASDSINFIAIGLVVGALLIYLGGARLHPQLGRAGVLVLGATSLLVAVLVDYSTSSILMLLGTGALLVFVGMNLVSPLFARPAAWVLGWLPSKMFGVSGRLSQQNAARSPRRTATTASALMIGLALVGMVTVLGQSFKQTLADTLDDSVNSDWLICVDDCNNENAAFSPQAAQAMDALPETESVISFRARSEAARSTADEKVRNVMSTDLDLLLDHLDPDIVAGDTTGAGRGDLLLHDETAEDLGVGVGDEVELEFTGGTTETFTVAALFSDNTILLNWVIDNEAWDEFITGIQDQFISAITAAGITPEQARTALASVTVDYPQLEVRDQAEFRQSQESQIDTFLNIVNVLLAVSVLVALLGIANTLALSVFERTRELGLLRAVGMTRKQARRMIRWEGAIVATFGGLMGTIIGILFGWAATAVIPDNFISAFEVPWPTLLLYLAIAVLAGLLAASFPARRAGRLNVLEAIAHN